MIILGGLFRQHITRHGVEDWYVTSIKMNDDTDGAVHWDSTKTSIGEMIQGSSGAENFSRIQNG